MFYKHAAKVLLFFDICKFFAILVTALLIFFEKFLCMSEKNTTFAAKNAS